MIGDHDPDAARPQIADDLADVGDRQGIDAREGFVQEHVGGLGGQRPGDFHPAAFASGQGDGRRLAQVIDPQFRKESRYSFPGAAPVRLAQLDHGHDVLLHRHAPENGGLLRKVTEAHPRTLVHGLGGDLLAVQPDGALIGGDQAGDHVEAGRLAGAVRAEESLHLAPAKTQGYALDHRTAAVGLADPVDNQTVVFGRLHAGPTSARRAVRPDR